MSDEMRGVERTVIEVLWLMDNGRDPLAKAADFLSNLFCNEVPDENAPWHGKSHTTIHEAHERGVRNFARHVVEVALEIAEGERLSGKSEAHTPLDDISAAEDLGACYDRPETADQDGQTSSGALIATDTGQPVGVRHVRLSEVLVLRAGDYVDMRLRPAEDGSLVVSELEVTRRGDREREA